MEIETWFTDPRPELPDHIGCAAWYDLFRSSNLVLGFYVNSCHLQSKNEPSLSITQGSLADDLMRVVCMNRIIYVG